MEVAHIDAWRRDPDRFWRFYGERFASLVDKQPNDAHRALAELERRGLVKAVITQNIDRLHSLAGTRRLIEVHGSIESSVCLQCGGKLPLERVVRAARGGRRRARVPGLHRAAEARRGAVRRAAARARAVRGAGARDRRGPDAVRGLVARGLPGRRAAGDHARGRGPAGARDPGPDALRRRRRGQARPATWSRSCGPCSRRWPTSRRADAQPPSRCRAQRAPPCRLHRLVHALGRTSLGAEVAGAARRSAARPRARRACSARPRSSATAPRAPRAPVAPPRAPGRRPGPRGRAAPAPRPPARRSRPPSSAAKRSSGPPSSA